MRLASFVLSAILFCAPVSRLAAQKTTPSSDVEVYINAVERFYQQTKTVRARFEQAYFHKVYQRYDRSTGTVVFAKPARMRWDYQSGKVVVSDGQWLTFYEAPSPDQKRGQAFKRSWKDSELSHALSFLMGTANLRQSFTAQLLQDGATPWVALELVPKESQASYQKLVMYVDKDPKRRGVVRRVVLIDYLGNRNRFDFLDLKFNEKIGEDIFRWKPPAQTDWIQPPSS